MKKMEPKVEGDRSGCIYAILTEVIKKKRFLQLETLSIKM